MSRLLLDVRIAVRTAVRSRFVSALAVIAFALGIGVTTAVFSIFNAVLLRPLPFPDPGQLVVVYDTQPACKTCPASYPKYIDWKTRNRVFAAIGGAAAAQFVMTGSGEPVRVRAAATTASLIDVFGVRPQIGRWYTADEDQPGGRKVAVLSHAFWTKRFNTDPSIVGRTLTFDGEACEVIGVMPERFSLRGSDVFVPLQRKLDPSTRGSHFLQVFARLKKGVTLDRASADMRALGVALAHEFGHNHGIDVRSYTEVIVGNVRTPLQVLFGAVALVLLIACANVSNLLLASGVARRRELAIRVALGAGQKDLARQLTLESLVLAVAGGALGVVLATWAIRGFVALAGNQLPRATTIEIDGRVLAFSAAISFAVGVFCGLWPLVLIRRKEVAAAVREGDTRTGSGTGRRFGSALVVAEIAIAFALLVGAGLLVKNLVLLRGRDAGLRTDRVVSFELAPGGARYQSPQQVRALYREVYSRLEQIGAIESVGMTSHLPMFNFGYNGEMTVDSGNPWGPNEAPLVEYRWMYGDYLKTLGIPLVMGRLLDHRDGDGTTTVLINHSMAEKFWPGRDPIGHRFGQGSDRSRWYQVVGVIADVRSYGLARSTPYEFYRTLDQAMFPTMTVVIRTRDGDPKSIIPTARQIVASMDPALPLTSVQTMEEVVAASIGEPRLMSALTALFAALAGLLAIVGVYGVMAYNVRTQRRDFGIRLALGAAESTLRWMVIARGLALAVAGIAIGAFGAWILTGVLRSMLNDVKPTDPTVFAATAGAMLLVALAAAYLPARAAGRVDPMIVLRTE